MQIIGAMAMNLMELSKLDIKDLKKINYEELWQNIRSRPENLLSGVLVLAAVIFGLYHFFNQQAQGRASMLKNRLLGDKIKIVDAYHQAKTELDDFMKNLPLGLTEAELIRRITDFAIARNIRIESFAPTRKEQDKIYTLTSITLEVSSKEYSNLWLFINDIEKSPDTMRLDSWAGGTMEDGLNMRRKQKTSAPDEIPDIRVSMEVSSVNFKNEN